MDKRHLYATHKRQGECECLCRWGVRPLLFNVKGYLLCSILLPLPLLCFLSTVISTISLIPVMERDGMRVCSYRNIWSGLLCMPLCLAKAAFHFLGESHKSMQILPPNQNIKCKKMPFCIKKMKLMFVDHFAL